MINNNAGWDDEFEVVSTLDISRNELHQRLLSKDTTAAASSSSSSLSSSSAAEKQEIATFHKDKDSYEDIKKYLDEFGVVKITGLFDNCSSDGSSSDGNICSTGSVIASFRSASQRALEKVTSTGSIAWSADGSARETKDLGGTEDNLGLSICTRHSTGRFDLYPADSEHLIPELSSILDWQPLLDRLVRDSIDCSSFHINSCGFIPTLPSTLLDGDWHRDIKSMFAWKSSSKGSAELADKFDCLHMPDFYFTLFISLDDSPTTGSSLSISGNVRQDKDNKEDKEDKEEVKAHVGIDGSEGELEVILGSHRCSVSESMGLVTGRNKVFKAGDVVLLNGKCLHRGTKNVLPAYCRHAIYVVFSAKWYADV